MARSRFLLVLALLAGFFQLEAQQTSEGFSIVDQSKGKIRIKHNISQVEISKSNTTEGDILSAKGVFSPNVAGAPDLPSHSTFIAIPKGAEVSLKIVKAETHTINNIDLIPAAVPQLDNDNSPVVHQKDMNIYGKNAFYPRQPFRLSAPTTVRGVEVIALEAMPFQYNPVTKELIAYDEVELEIEITGEGDLCDTRYRTKEWDHILSDIILNFNDLPKVDYCARLRKHYESKESGCEYMILTPDNPDFIQLADSIRRFRIAQGIPTEIFTVSDCGGNDENAIYSFIRNAYSNWDMPPAAVELLGDHNTDPTLGIVSHSMNNHPGGDGYNPYISDHAYSDMNGNQMSDIIIGRITGRNFDELYHIIKKDLDYERTPPTNPDFYDKPVTAMGFQLERWFQLCSEIVNGFWEHALGKHPVRLNAVYEGTPGSRWSSADNTNTIINYFGPNGCGYIPQNMSHLTEWDANANQINEAINNGAFIVQHRDHGAEELWGEPRYGISNIKKLNNKDLTYVMSNNCLTGKFNYGGQDGCFAEVFHRHAHGALGLIAATEVSYSFVNDVYVWGVYDNLWPDFMPSFGTEHPTDFVLPAFGNAAGKYFLRQSSWTDNWIKEITYYLFHHHGDVYMNLYTEMPQMLSVDMLPVLTTGSDTYTLKADEGALICLSVDDHIIGLDYATGDTQQITVTPQELDAQVKLTITKQNHYRYENYITIIPDSGPYLIFNKIEVNDESGNQNGEADYNETCKLHLNLHNVGFEEIEDVNVSLQCEHPAITILNGSTTFSKLETGEILSVENAFEVHFGDAIEDAESITFHLSMSNGNFTFEDHFKVRVNAPVLQYTDLSMSDSEGNTIDRFTKGETAWLHFNIENQGHSKSLSIDNHLVIKAPFVSIAENDITVGPIEVGASTTADFQVTINDDAIDSGILNYRADATSDSHTSLTEGELSLGYTAEDFEDEDLNPSILWSLGSGSLKWQVDSLGGLDNGGCLRTPEMGDNKNAMLRIGFSNPATDVFTFYHKVSSEANDKLELNIDAFDIGEWSAEDEWKKEEITLKPGNHLIKFVYSKNASGSAGDDCARIDRIQLPPLAELILFAGDDTNTCNSESFTPDAYALHQKSIIWSTNGDGHFDNETTEQPSYFYGVNDLESRNVQLTMTAVSEQNGATKSDVVNIKLLPDLSEVQPEKPQGENNIDLHQVTQSQYHTNDAEDANFVWTLEPEAAGTLQNEGNIATITWNPDFKGEANISLVVSNDCGESLESESLTVLVFNSFAVGEHTSDKMRIFPNPASDRIRIEAEQLHDTQVLIRLIDINGRIVTETQATAIDGKLQTSLDTQTLGRGIFNLQIIAGNETRNQTIIIH